MNDLHAPKLEFGVNLNNREPLIAPNYSLSDLLALSCTVEERGFDSIWVGDSLFSKPRYEPLTLLAAISQRTTTAQLGTACLLSAMRNPLYLALEWATLDRLSGGRTILGACMGNAEEGVKREYAALGLDFARRAEIHSAIRETGGDASDCATAYQVTMNIADSRDEAWQGLRGYIDAYYPELGQFLDLAEWGPVGTPEDIIAWIRTFADAGVRHFICRFGSTDQFGQVERFVRDVLPAFGENRD